MWQKAWIWRSEGQCVLQLVFRGPNARGPGAGLEEWQGCGTQERWADGETKLLMWGETQAANLGPSLEL